MCNLCPFRASRRGQLREHVRTMHSEAFIDMAWKKKQTKNKNCFPAQKKTVKKRHLLNGTTRRRSLQKKPENQCSSAPARPPASRACYNYNYCYSIWWRERVNNVIMIPGARTERRSNRAHPYLLHSNYRVFLVMSLENDEFPIFCFFVRGGRNKISSKARCLFRMGERRVYSFHDFCRNYPSCLRGLLTIHRLDCWVLTSLKVEKSYETIWGNGNESLRL